MDNIGGKSHEKNRKFIRRFLIGIIVVLLVIVAGVTALFWNELRTISSITKIDDYGAYQMTYYGDYGFDEFLEVGAESDVSISTVNLSFIGYSEEYLPERTKIIIEPDTEPMNLYSQIGGIKWIY